MPGVATSRPRRAPARGTARELVWRCIRDEPRRGPTNMALDHALATCLGSGEGVLRLYGWSTPTVSFGRNEPAARVASAELAYVRRPTGGRAVLHDRELTYAVVMPLDASGRLREAYLGINEALAEGVRSLGAEVGLAPVGETLGPEAGPCFQSPAHGEIVAGGRKVIGSAQARVEGVFLQHGSILLGGDQGVLGGARTEVTLSELLGTVDYDAVADATADALRRSFGGEWAEGQYSECELEVAARLERDRYAQDTWTWRR